MELVVESDRQMRFLVHVSHCTHWVSHPLAGVVYALPMAETAVLFVRVPIEWKPLIERAAANDNRSINSYMCVLLEDHLEGKGLLD